MFALSSLRRPLRVAAAIALLLGILSAGGGAAAAAGAQVAAPPPIPPGAARLWFYRDFFPEDTGGMPPIAMNGATIGYALAGTSFYRDVAAGQYHLSVQSVGTDYNQAQDVNIAPGMQLYVKIASLSNWVEGTRGGYRGGTYYVMIVSPQLASVELPQTSYVGGS